MLLGPFATFCHLDLVLHNLGECGLTGREGSCSALLHVHVRVPGVLLLFSHLRPQELVRHQPSDGLRDKVCLRLLLRHILGREVESSCDEFILKMQLVSLAAFRRS